MLTLRTALLAAFLSCMALVPQELGFRWVNPMPEGAYEGVEHGTYHSELMGLDVGYLIYLPPGYEDPAEAGHQYPVVYFLPGGRVGSEVKGITLAESFDQWIRSGVLQPRIYVFVNGGPEGYFDYGDSWAESSFVRELIPHIDGTYRTIDNRLGRAVEGFSMGGRATARIAFKYPELFCSAAPMSGGHQKEQLMSETEGREARGSMELVHEPSNNSWDLAGIYAQRTPRPDLDIFVAVGSADPNYQGNLDWMEHLGALGIPFEQRIAPEVTHEVSQLLQALGPAVELFHEGCFARAEPGGV